MKKIVLFMIALFAFTSCMAEKKEKVDTVEETTVTSQVDNKERINFATNLIKEIISVMETEEFIEKAKAEFDPVILEDKIPDINLYLQAPKELATSLIDSVSKAKIELDNSVFKTESEFIEFVSSNGFYPFDINDKERLEGMNESELALAAQFIKFDLIPMETSKSIFEDQFTESQLTDIYRISPEQGMINEMMNLLVDQLLIAEEKK